MEKVGKEGVITVEEGTSLENELKLWKACSSTAATSPLLHQQPGQHVG